MSTDQPTPHVGDTITVRRPHVENGPVGVPADKADADYLRSAVRNIEHREDAVRGLWGSGVTAMVVQLLTDAADVIERPDAPHPDATLHVVMSTLTQTLDGIVRILGEDADACRIDGEVDPDLMWDMLEAGYVPVSQRHPVPVDDAAVERAALLRECDLADAEMRKWVRVPVKYVRVALTAARAGEAEPRVVRTNQWEDGSSQDVYADGSTGAWRPAQRGGEAVDRAALREAMLSRWWMDQTGPDADHWETLDAEERENVAENSYVDTFLSAVLDFLAARGDAVPSVSAEQVAEVFCEPRHRDLGGWPLVGESRYCGRCIDKANAALGIEVRDA